ADWRAEYRDPQGRTGSGVVPNVEAVNILSRAQQEADSYVAQTQAYCRRLAVDARDHAQQILTEAQAQAEEAANLAVQGYRAGSGDTYTPEFEELERRLSWARRLLL